MNNQRRLVLLFAAKVSAAEVEGATREVRKVSTFLAGFVGTKF